MALSQLLVASCLPWPIDGVSSVFTHCLFSTCISLYIQFNFFLLLFKYSCLHFHPTAAPHPTHPCFSALNLPLMALSMCPLYMFLMDFPLFSLLSPLHLPSGYCQFALYSMSLVVFCFLVCFVDQIQQFDFFYKDTKHNCTSTSLHALILTGLLCKSPISK